MRKKVTSSWYSRNKEISDFRNKTLVENRRKEWFKVNSPCKHCNSWDNLELDHMDPSTKTVKVTSNIWHWNIERRLKELSNCQILCNSCHKKKTAAGKEWCKGEAVGSSKLISSQVLKIRELKENGISTTNLSKIFVVSESTIRAIITRKIWKHI